MHGSRTKIPGKKSVRQRCAEGFNFGVKGFTNSAYLDLVRKAYTCSAGYKNYLAFLRNEEVHYPVSKVYFWSQHDLNESCKHSAS
jgi:hypothetical protein